MHNQPNIDFATKSPINTEKLTKQTKKLFDWLNAGNTIHLFHPAKRALKIGFINSRIPEIKKAGYVIYKRRIKAVDSEGDLVDVVEYSMKPFS